MAACRIPVLPTNKIVDLLFRNVQYAHSGNLQNTAECHICNEPFLTGCSPERPVILRCGHIMGEGCILKWMSPLSRHGRQNSCPLCREPLLDLRALEVPTTHTTQAGGSERNGTWHQVWDELCYHFSVDMRILSAVLPIIVIFLIALLLFIIHLERDTKPSPWRTDVMRDGSRINPTGHLGFLNPTYR